MFWELKKKCSKPSKSAYTLFAPKKLKLGFFEREKTRNFFRQISDLHMLFAHTNKPHSHKQFFLSNFIARADDQQVFFYNFPLTRFPCSCRWSASFPWQVSVKKKKISNILATFSLLSVYTSKFLTWQFFLVKEKLARQIFLDKENLSTIPHLLEQFFVVKANLSRKNCSCNWGLSQRKTK